MPLKLKGSCSCGAVAFTVDSHTPYPYQLCYCSICRKTAGGGGYAINIMGDNASLKIDGRKGTDAVGVYRAEIRHGDACKTSSGERNFCVHCGSALWMYDPSWPELVHPFASAIDTRLPAPPVHTHLMLRYRADWVTPAIGVNDLSFDEYPEQSIEQWHNHHRLWVD